MNDEIVIHPHTGTIGDVPNPYFFTAYMVDFGRNTCFCLLRKKGKALMGRMFIEKKQGPNEEEKATLLAAIEKRFDV